MCVFSLHYRFNTLNEFLILTEYRRKDVLEKINVKEISSIDDSASK